MRIEVSTANLDQVVENVLHRYVRYAVVRLKTFRLGHVNIGNSDYRANTRKPKLSSRGAYQIALKLRQTTAY